MGNSLARIVTLSSVKLMLPCSQRNSFTSKDLTTNARHTKYCGGYAPGDKLHRTCRQIGNLKGREQRELADDHPLKQIYEKRLNTINRYVKRGTLDADLAEVMKKLAKDKMLQALSNVAYAKGDYEKEMGQAALKKEALKVTYRYKQ